MKSNKIPKVPTDKTIEPWETLSSVMALDEKWFPVRKDTVKLPSGKIINDFFVWITPHIVTVVPVTKDGKFILCQQYRHGISTIIYQFPAGGAKKSESSEDAARRELEEETGYVGGKLTHLTSVSPFAHKMTDLEDVYLIEGVTPDGVALDEEDEQINVVLKTPTELREMIDNNEIKTAVSLVGGLLALKKLGLD
ncbi:MAG: NUDIX hydrolase [bacterium]|nr:NUDIX hydrolase [bacterium]